MHRHLRLSFLLVLLSSLASAQQAGPAANAKPTTTTKPVAPVTSSSHLPSEETVNAFMHEMFGYEPSLNWKIVDIKPSQAAGLAEVTVVIGSPQGQQLNRFYVTPDGQHAVVGEVIPFGVHPFDADAAKLKQGVTGPARGPANAPVTIVEFSDLQCPHCKGAQPVLDRLLSENSNVRLVFESFPLPNHDWAEKAAYYADCISRSSNDAFWKFIESVYSAQSDILTSNADEKLTALAEQAGAKGPDIAACADKPETAGRVERSVMLGRSLNVTATPTAFINGRKVVIGEIPYEGLKQLVNFAAQEKK